MRFIVKTSTMIAIALGLGGSTGSAHRSVRFEPSWWSSLSCCTNALVISLTAVSIGAELRLFSNSSFASTMFLIGVALT
jgi:hypothetical protein